ncbi:biotin synthase BioB [Massilia pinisoli]|uniref:Biotin synthase n=1 Tax=Massilia pinisoli TaxID=1772194 RepID=A0ABT1ZYJ6_9BURK|nr:biotin synthase BioB [Massilia pinisoli]MCS0584993.1 biotin synthase BioB [Massilia pinisoli]
MTQVVTLHPPVTPASLPKDATWPLADVLALFELPMPELMFRASQAHRANFPDGDVELATLLSIKTGGCEEDCGYCPQAARYDTGVEAKKILDLDTVLDAAREAKAKGATRFCMGAAWRSPKERDMEKVEAMVRGVKALGMETCATLGMLEEGQAEQLKQAGLDYYNHNIDTSPDFYGDVISTREYRDRLDTLGRVRTAGLKICCGGIVGMGETREQRAGLIAQLANMNPYPESVPINHLVQVEGTPMHGLPPLDPIEFVRTIAVARITMPKARVRLSAGRRELGEAVQAMCFMAGANSIFYGDKLLTTDNPEADDDRKLLEKLGLKTRSAMLESVQKQSCGC